ncbi:MAG: TonB-dependent receptor [Bacteroidota bacterium]
MNVKALSLLLCSFFLLSAPVLAQNEGMRIVDSRTGKAVAYAHIKIVELGSTSSRFFVSDFDGNVRFNVVVPVQVQVTYVGYQALTDTIVPGEKPLLRMLPEVFSLDEVVVTAQYNPGSSDKSLYRVNVINQLQMRRAAVTDLSSVLRNQMNIRFSQDASLGTGMSLQGLSGEHVKILVDGVPVIGRLNGSVDLSQVNVQNARQIEIIEGPMSVIYGSNAMAGVINIITNELPRKSFTANAGTYLESVGKIDLNGGFSVSNGKNSIGLQAARNFFAGYSPEDDGRASLWKPKRQVITDLDYRLMLKKVILKSRFSYFDELLLIRGSTSAPYYYKAFDNHFGTRRYTATVDLATKGPNPLTLSNSLSVYNRVRTLYFNDLSVPEKWPLEYDTTGFGSLLSRAMYSLRTESGKLGSQFGYDVTHEWGTGERLDFDSHDITDVGVFSTFQYSPFSWLALQPGIRFIWNSRFKAPLVYALHLKGGAYKGFVFRASYAKGFRAPSLKELYMSFVDSNHDLKGNADLLPEYSENIQFQVTHRIEKVTYATETEVKLFYNNIHDQITLLPVLGAASELQYTYYNVDQTKTLGYTTSLRSSLYPMFDLRIGWGTTGMATGSEGMKVSKYFWTPEVGLDVTCRLDKMDLHFTASYKYTGTTPILSVTDGDELTQSYQEAYHNLDFSVLKSFFDKRLSVSSGLRNIFDVKNIISTGASGGIHSQAGMPVAWGRTVFVKITYGFQKNEKKK